MRTNNFRTIGQSSNRNFGAAASAVAEQHPQQAFNGFNNYQRDEEPVVAWLNIMIEGQSGERKKLGKGIPLRESNPLERAILDLLINENGERNDVDADMLIDALRLDVRAASAPDEDFAIAIPAFAIGTKPVKPAKAQAQEQQEEGEVEEVAPVEVKPKRTRVVTK